MDEANRSLRDLYARHALPYITFYSLLATTAGAIPVPWVDLLILPGIQTRMVHHMAGLYGQPLEASTSASWPARWGWACWCGRVSAS